MATTIIGFGLGQLDPGDCSIRPSSRSASSRISAVAVLLRMAAFSLSAIRLNETTQTQRSIGLDVSFVKACRFSSRATCAGPCATPAALQPVGCDVYAGHQPGGIDRQPGPTGFGTLLAMSGLGMAIGAVLTAQLGHQDQAGTISGAAGLAAITVRPPCWASQGRLLVTLMLSTVLGIGAALVAIPAQTTIQGGHTRNRTRPRLRPSEQSDQHRFQPAAGAGRNSGEQHRAGTRSDPAGGPGRH